MRTRGAGLYDFSQDATERAEQMASLKAQRKETERAQATASQSSAQAAKKRKIEERRALIEAKRKKMMGAEEVDRLREVKRAAEAERLLKGLESEL